MRKTWVGLLLAFAASVVYAGGTEFFVNDTPEAYQRGKLQEMEVTPEGTLKLSLAMKELLNVKEAQFWCLAEGEGDVVYAGTPEGKVMRVSPEPAVVLAELPKVGVFSLVWHGGALYAGTGPEGVVYRVKEGAKAEKFCATGEEYVWTLVPDGKGNLLAGTGPNGKLLRIDAEGKTTVVLDALEPHVMSVVADPEGVVYASTDGKGLLYRIQADGTSQVMYDAAESEIRCLAMDGEGNVYFGTADTSGGRRRGPAGPPATGSGGATGGASKGVGTARTRVSMPGSGDGSVSATNAIYRMDTAGMVLKLASLENLMVLSMVWTPEGLYFGTGNSGHLGLIDKKHDLTWVRKKLESQVLSLAVGSKGELLIATAGEGRVLAMGPGCATEGTFLSPVLDGGLVSKFGVISWRSRQPEETGIEVTTRTGNVEKVDDSWSEFSAPCADPKGSVVANPPARYIQYRVRMTSKGGTASPEVDQVRISYLSTNQPPQVKDVTVDGREQRNGGNGGGREKAPGGQKLIVWKAEDADGDTMEFTVSFRGSDETLWKTLKERIEENKLVWDVSAVPDGYYRIRVVASDAPSNAGKRAMTGEHISKAILVDNTAAVLKALEVRPAGKGAASVKTSATDGASRLSKASYSVDGGDWQLLDPVDGLLDQQTETFEFTVTELSAGEHTVTVQVSDEAGNVSSVKSVFLVK